MSFLEFHEARKAANVFSVQLVWVARAGGSERAAGLMSSVIFEVATQMPAAAANDLFDQLEELLDVYRRANPRVFSEQVRGGKGCLYKGGEK